MGGNGRYRGDVSLHPHPHPSRGTKLVIIFWLIGTFGEVGAQALGGKPAPVFRLFRSCVPSLCLVFE
jgi:hypothetical protein